MVAGGRQPRGGGWLVYQLSGPTGLLALICASVLCSAFGVLAVCIGASLPQVSSLGSATPAPSPQPSIGEPLAGNDWIQYRYDVNGTGANPEGLVSSATINELTLRWSLSGLGIFAATPAVVGDTIYVPNMHSLYAFDLRSGAVRWRFDAEATPYPFINSSVAVDTALHLAYFGDPAARFYAVDTRTGKAAWSVVLDASTGAHIWGSPLLVNDKLYIGVASHADNPCVRGSVFALEPATGAIVWTYYASPADLNGGGVWSSVSANPELHEVMATTGNPCSTHEAQGQEDSIVGLDWDTGKLLWKYQAIDYDDCDCDFGQGTVDAVYRGREYIVAGNKYGAIYGLSRDPSGGSPQLAWRVTARPGVASPPTYSNGLVFVPAGAPLDGSCRYGAVYAIHIDSGALAWRVCTGSQVLSPSALSGDILFLGYTNMLVAYEASTGRMLRTFSINGTSWGGVTVSHGFVLVDTAGGRLYAFSL
jgi:polyvinyl alcohol dehydrogenase (cytochrome)